MHCRQSVERERWHKRRSYILPCHYTCSQAIFRAVDSSTDNVIVRLSDLSKAHIQRSPPLHRFCIPQEHLVPDLLPLCRPASAREKQSAACTRRRVQPGVYVTPSMVTAQVYQESHITPCPPKSPYIPSFSRDQRLECPHEDESTKVEYWRSSRR